MFLFSFFPAGLSLVIELMFTKAGRPQWDVKQIIKSLPTETEPPVQNPVVYRVRVIAMTCLVVVHTLCRSVSHVNIEALRLVSKTPDNPMMALMTPVCLLLWPRLNICLCRWPMDSSVSGAGRAASYISSEWLKLILANAEQIGILSIVTALAVRSVRVLIWFHLLLIILGSCSMRIGRRTTG